MFDNIKTEGYIVNMEPQRFTNKETGEVKCMTKITYTIKAPKTEYFVGGAILTAYSSDKAFNLLERFVLQKANLTIEQRPTDKGSKYYLLSVNDINLK